jgi:hypothetical protein
MARIVPHAHVARDQGRLEALGLLEPVDVCRDCLPGEGARWPFRALFLDLKRKVNVVVEYAEAPYDRGSDASQYVCEKCGQSLSLLDRTPGFGLRGRTLLYSRHLDG